MTVLDQMDLILRELQGRFEVTDHDYSGDVVLERKREDAADALGQLRHLRRTRATSTVRRHYAADCIDIALAALLDSVDPAWPPPDFSWIPGQNLYDQVDEQMSLLADAYHVAEQMDPPPYTKREEYLLTATVEVNSALRKLRNDTAQTPQEKE